MGIYFQRRRIEHLIQHRQAHINTDLSRSTFWLPPMAALGVSTAFLKPDGLAPHEVGWLLIGYMAVVALMAVATARDIAVSVLDLSLLFEDFSSSAAHRNPIFSEGGWFNRPFFRFRRRSGVGG